MGLDVVEFLINLEEKFHIYFRAEDENKASKIETIGDVISHVENIIAEFPHSSAEAERNSQNGMTTLSEFFARELNKNSSELFPKTEIKTLFKTLAERRRIWKKMQREISPNIPSLQGKTYCNVGGGICVFIGFFTGLGFIIELNDGSNYPIVNILLGIVSGFTAGGLLFLSGIFLFSPFFSAIPDQCRTLGNLIRYIVPTENFLDPNGQLWTRETITETVLHIASNQSGVPVEKISLLTKLTELF
jgi:hypothetical protein